MDLLRQISYGCLSPAAPMCYDIEIKKLPTHHFCNSLIMKVTSQARSCLYLAGSGTDKEKRRLKYDTDGKYHCSCL